MSDCFDHEVDAWESRDWETGEDIDHSWYGYKRTKSKFDWKPKESKPFKPDPLYYHTKIRHYGIELETEKAYLLIIYINGNTQWIPKKLCRFLTEDTVYVYTKFLIEEKVLYLEID